jgi:catechol 2,3-dioxygenase
MTAHRGGDMTINVQRVGHVVLNVSDLDPAVGFYRDILGLREVGRYGGNMVFFSATGENHHDLAVVALGADAPKGRSDSTGLCHIALKIGGRLDSLRSAKSYLDNAGIAIKRIENHRVSQSVYISDPDGNEIELYVDDDASIWASEPSAVATVEPLAL